jgi:hypothetical protein
VSRGWAGGERTAVLARLAIAVSVLTTPAAAWINLRDSGNELTFQTNVQVGDWEYDTTVVPMDLFVTGSAHVGSNQSRVEISKDATVTASLFADSAEVSTVVVTNETRSTGILKYSSATGSDIEFHPGFLGQMAVHSDVVVDGRHTATADIINATSNVVLGGLLFNVGTGTFNDASVTFELAQGGAVAVEQRSGRSLMTLASTDTSAAAAANVLLHTTTGQYTVATTHTGTLEVAISPLGGGASTRLLHVRTVQPDSSSAAVDVDFELAGGVHVRANGARIHGGMDVLNAGMRLNGSASVVGGMTVTNAGLLIESGSMNVTGGVRIIDGFVQNSSFHVRSGGLTVALGGLNVSRGGLAGAPRLSCLSVHPTRCRCAAFRLTGGTLSLLPLF